MVIIIIIIVIIVIIIIIIVVVMMMMMMMMMLMMMMIIIIIMVPRSIHELRAVISLLDYLMDRVFLRMCEVPRRMVFCCLGSFRCSVSDPFLTRPRAPVITGTVVVFNPHVFSISISRSLYFMNFSTVFKVLCVTRQVLSFLSFTTISVCFYLLSCQFGLSSSSSS